jgi:putative membrane protein
LKTILKILLTAVAVIILEYILPGITVKSYWSAVWVAIVLSLLNLFIKPVLVVLTFPITIVTLGLFLLVINAVIIKMAAYFIDGFSVKNIWWALAFSLLLSLLQSILHSPLKKEK